MSEHFNFKAEYNGVSVQYTDSLSVFEREIHSYHELLFCEEEKLTLRTENKPIGIKSGEVVIIPKGVYHFFDLSNLTSFKRIKISFDDELIKSLGFALFSNSAVAVSSLEVRLKTILKRLSDLISKGKRESEIFAYSAAMMLLCELEIDGIKSTEPQRKNNEIIVRTAKRISENLSGPLSVADLAKRENVSPSFLTHSFKKELGISVHKYVLARRMIFAKELIESGEKPTKIYISCGFGDYSSFYKAYLSYFGEPPSARNRKD